MTNQAVDMTAEIEEYQLNQSVSRATSTLGTIVKERATLKSAERSLSSELKSHTTIGLSYREGLGFSTEELKLSITYISEEDSFSTVKKGYYLGTQEGAGSVSGIALKYLGETSEEVDALLSILGKLSQFAIEQNAENAAKTIESIQQIYTK